MSSNASITDTLLKLKQRIEAATAEKNRVEGEMRQLKKAMSEEFNTDSVDEIETKVAALRKQADKLESQIGREIEALKKELGE